MDQKNSNSTNSTNLRDFIIIIFLILVISISIFILFDFAQSNYSSPQIQDDISSKQKVQLPSPKLEIKIPIFSSYNNRLAAPYPGKSGIHLYNGRDTMTIPFYGNPERFIGNPGLSLFSKISRGSGVKIIACGGRFIDDRSYWKTDLWKIVGTPKFCQYCRGYEYGAKPKKDDLYGLDRNTKKIEIDYQKVRIPGVEEAYSFNPDSPLESGYYYFCISSDNIEVEGSYYKHVFFRVE